MGITDYPDIFYPKQAWKTQWVDLENDEHTLCRMQTDIRPHEFL